MLAARKTSSTVAAVIPVSPLTVQAKITPPREITPVTAVVPPVSATPANAAPPKANSPAAAPVHHQLEPVVDPRFTDLHAKIKRLRDEYTLAIGRFEKRINRSCFGCFAFFSTYEMNTKIAKRNAMQELLNTSNLDELRQMAEKIQRGGGRVMRSANTHNVVNLLNEILGNGAKSSKVLVSKH